MADTEVEITNVGGANGVASEATLKDLVKAMNKLAKEQDGSVSGDDLEDFLDNLNDASDNLDDYNNNLDDANQNLDDFTAELEDGTKIVEGFGEKLKNIGSLVNAGLIQPIFGLGQELLMGGDTIGDFSRHVTDAISAIPLIGPAIAGPIDLFVGLIDQNVQNFRELSSAGVDFGGSLINLRRQAAESGMSFDQFANIVSNNSEALALFGGSAREGAQRFAQVNKSLQTQFGPQFSALGMTVEETSEYLTEFLEMQTRLGRSNELSNRQLQTQTASYIMQLDELAKLTGRQRDEIAKSMQEQTQDARIRGILSTLDEGARAQLQGVLTMTEGMGPDFNEAIREMVATGGAPMSDFGRALVNANPELSSLSRGLRDGTVSQDQFMQAIREASSSVSDMTEEEKRSLAAAAALGNEYARAQLSLIGFENIAENAAQVTNEQREAMMRGNDAILDFNRRIIQVRNQIVGSLIDSDVFQTLEGGMNSLIELITSDQVMGELENVIQSISDFVSGMISDIEQDGLMPTLKKYLNEGLTNIGNVLGDILTSALTSAFTSPVVIGGIAGIFASKALINGVVSRLVPSLFSGNDQGSRRSRGPARGSRTAGGRIGTNIGGALGGLTGGVIEGVGNGLAALGPKAPLILAGAGAIGGAIGLIGAGIAGATWLMGSALPTLSEGLKSFEDLDAASLQQAGSGMTALAGGLAAFGGANIVAGIGNLFQTDEGLTPTLDQLTDFQSYNINSERVRQNAEGLIAFGEALSSSGAGAMMSGLGSAVSAISNTVAEFFGGETGIPYNDIIEFQGYNFDVEKIRANAAAMIEFNNALSSASGVQASSGIENMIGSISSFIAGIFGGDSPIDQVREFGQMDIDPEGVTRNSQAMVSMANALGSFSGQGIDDIEIPRNVVSRLEDLAEINGDGLTLTAEGLQSIANIQGLQTNINAIRDGFDADDIRSYNTALEDLVDTLRDLNDELSRDNNGVFSAGTGENAGTVLGRMGSAQGSTGISEDKIDRLNSTMSQILTILSQSKDIHRRQLGATQSLAGNVYRGF